MSLDKNKFEKLLFKTNENSQVNHFPEERVSNRLNRDSLADCCLYSRINMETLMFPNVVSCVFLKRHLLAE